MTASTDRELLELAAKAVGICLDWEWDGPPDQWQPWYYEDKTLRHWNPFTDDGDALRMAVMLGFGISIPLENKRTDVLTFGGPLISVIDAHGADPCAATRRAIVRAAAEIGGAA